MWTRCSRRPSGGEQRHTQDGLRRLRVYVVKIDVIVASEIEIRVDTQHVGACAEVLLLLFVAKHQKGRVGHDFGAYPAVRRFDRAHGIEGSYGVRRLSIRSSAIPESWATNVAAPAAS